MGNTDALGSHAHSRDAARAGGRGSGRLAVAGYALGRGSGAREATEIKRELESTGLFKVDVKGYEWTDFQKRWAGGKLDAYAVEVASTCRTAPASSGCGV
jgi:peptide/nickel transport system substrate-binding protein